MKILIMGLPGAGKTWLAERFVKVFNSVPNGPKCAWFNADQVRSMVNDWDFSEEARVRQAKRMRTYADFEVSHGRFALCDFVAPTVEAREQFDPDILIWVDTIKEGRFEDTNNMFQAPKNPNFTVVRKLSDREASNLANSIHDQYVGNMLEARNV
jgi:adenylylsulfate kinase